jgi:hypothetical protein
MAAVEKIGVRPAGYVLDWPELDYGYRARWLGFTSCMSHISVLHNRWTGAQGCVAHSAARPAQVQALRLLTDAGLLSRPKLIYFWLYQPRHGRLRQIVRSVMNSCAFAATFTLRPISQRRQPIAFLHGIQDGLTMHLERRY